MSISLDRTALVLLASGLSRRYGRRDKLLAPLAGRALVDHAAGVLGEMDVLTRVAVCPSDRPAIGERLQDRFVIAVNQQPRRGIGHSIAMGAQVAMQFRPDAIVVCMADMPFIEFDTVASLLDPLGDADIVHSGEPGDPRPPTAFAAAAFDALQKLDGDSGARPLMTDPALHVVALAAPAPLLRDVDTRTDLDLAVRQHDIRASHLGPRR